jgi:hypothetical protein
VLLAAAFAATAARCCTFQPWPKQMCGRRCCRRLGGSLLFCCGLAWLSGGVDLALRVVHDNRKRLGTLQQFASARGRLRAAQNQQALQRQIDIQQEIAEQGVMLRDSCCWGSLLDGVDVYSIEMPGRAGHILGQCQLFGVRGQVRTVPAITPHVPKMSGAIQRIVDMCAAKHQNESTRFESRWKMTQWIWQHSDSSEVLGMPSEVRPSEVSCTLSHLKALKRVCAARALGASSDIALVLEDDAHFTPMAYWPVPLRSIAATIPPNWTVVNVAPTNRGHSADMFAKKQYWRPNGGYNDWGTVGVMWNLANPATCALVRDNVSVREAQLCTATDVWHVCVDICARGPIV